MTHGPGTESLCYGGIRIRVAYSRLFNGISLIKMIFKGKKCLSPGLEKQMLLRLMKKQHLNYEESTQPICTYPMSIILNSPFILDIGKILNKYGLF